MRGIGQILRTVQRSEMLRLCQSYCNKSVDHPVYQSFTMVSNSQLYKNVLFKVTWGPSRTSFGKSLRLRASLIIKPGKVYISAKMINFEKKCIKPIREWANVIKHKGHDINESGSSRYFEKQRSGHGKSSITLRLRGGKSSNFRQNRFDSGVKTTFHFRVPSNNTDYPRNLCT